MVTRWVERQHLVERIRQHGAEYERDLGPAILEWTPTHFLLQTDHPANLLVNAKYLPENRRQPVRRQLPPPAEIPADWDPADYAKDSRGTPGKCCE